jgi:hypothetical protein
LSDSSLCKLDLTMSCAADLLKKVDQLKCFAGVYILENSVDEISGKKLDQI